MAALPVRFIHQTGAPMFDELKQRLREKPGWPAKSAPFIPDMPAAFAQADLVVCRSGAGAVSELAAAGKPSVLIPFPFAADQHQLKNAEAFERAGAAGMSLDRDWNGERMFQVTCRTDRKPRATVGDGRSRAKTGASRSGARAPRKFWWKFRAFSH